MNSPCYCGRDTPSIGIAVNGRAEAHVRELDCPARKGDPTPLGHLRELGRINGRPSAYERATKYRTPAEIRSDIQPPEDPTNG